MFAINHALTGAVIGLAVVNPVVALPAALASHFVCDAIPHFGLTDEQLGSRSFAITLLIDASLCGLLVLLLGVAGPSHWQLAAVCAFVAVTPDFAWLPGYLRVRRGGKFDHRPNLAMRLAVGIQWFQKPIGLLVEAAWLVGASVLLMAYL